MGFYAYMIWGVTLIPLNKNESQYICKKEWGVPSHKHAPLSLLPSLPMPSESHIGGKFCYISVRTAY